MVFAVVVQYVQQWGMHTFSSRREPELFCGTLSKHYPLYSMNEQVLDWTH